MHRNKLWNKRTLLVLALATAMFGLARSGESSAPDGRRLDVPGQVTGSVDIAAVTFSVISGGSAGWSAPITVAAFVVAAATDVNVRRIERYLTVAWQSGAVPIVLLTKADIAESLEELRAELEAVAMGPPVVVTSAVTGDGIDEILRELQPARTGVLLGPSGAGKSTLINRIVGSDLMRTRLIHRSGEGRHMTSHRQLVQLPQGGMIIDTPGLREAQLWEGEEALVNVFEDIEELALTCRFTDCAHATEPGCAIKAALEAGTLDAERFRSYRKLQRELRAVAAKTDARIRLEERKKWKQISVANKVRVRF